MTCFMANLVGSKRSQFTSDLRVETELTWRMHQRRPVGWRKEDIVAVAQGPLLLNVALAVIYQLIVGIKEYFLRFYIKHSAR